MTKDHPTIKDPHERLALSQREFGEYGGVNSSVERSATFTVLKADTLPDIFAGKIGPDQGGCYLYGRCFNPTTRQLGQQLAAMEGAEAGYCTSSGLAAITSALLALCDSGDHIVTSDTVYGGTHALLHGFFPKKFGITSTAVPVSDLAVLEAAIVPGKTKVLYAETVSNPTLVVADLPALAALAHKHGLTFVVDNTFAPMIVSPIRWGADVVVHSVTKFISGGSDMVAGAILGRAEFINSLMNPMTGPLMLLGPTMDPGVAAALQLRLPHLSLRIKEHGARAALFASRLEALGARVNYPGLASHPQHALFKSLANPGYGAGGVLGVDVRTPERAAVFMERLQNKHGFGLLAVSLGYFDTLMSASAGSTSSELSDEALDAAGISRGLIRISVGYTGSAEERWAALEETWRSLASVPDSVAKPRYRAVKFTKDARTGLRIRRSPSWLTFGSDDEEDAANGAGPGPADKKRLLQRWVKVVDESTEVEYVPLEAAPGPEAEQA